MNILKQKKLLYVEDEKIIQDQYLKYFENFFQEVITANDGQEGLTLYHETNPDVLILDINMPKLNGLELSKKIKESNQEIPIILISAYDDKDTLTTAIEIGILLFLDKPLQRRGVKKMLEKLGNIFESKNILELWRVNDSIYTFNHLQNKLYCQNEEIKLTRNETLLMKLFMEVNVKLMYQEIYEGVWKNQEKEYSESTIKSLISTLRKKLPVDAIENEYGMGYSLKYNL